MDRLGALPFEIRKRILNSLDSRRDVLRICSQSREMLTAARPLRKQYLETELGAGVIAAVFPDALAAVTFPRIDHATPDETQKKIMNCHLDKWRNKDLVDACTDGQKMDAAFFVDETVVPFVEDFAAKARNLDPDDEQLWFPSWVNEDRGKEAPIFVKSLFEYRPEERVRLLKAFCHFQILSKVIRARPGRQLWSMSEQKKLLKNFFDAWEVEGVICVQQYVGDLHTLLWINQLKHVAAAIVHANDEVIFGYSTHSGLFDKIINMLSYGPAHPHETGHIRSPFYMTKVLGSCVFSKTPVHKLEFVDLDTQSTFLKHLATFGLDFLHSMLMEDKDVYNHLIRTYGDAILAKITNPQEAAHFGADADWIWIALYMENGGDNEQGNGSNSNDNVNGDDGGEGDEKADPPINLGRDPGIREGKANLAWKLLKNASQTSRYGFRRCGWVFWDEERLRELKFWDMSHDIDADSLPQDLAWAAHRDGASTDSEEDTADQDDMSPAEKKLSSLAEEKTELLCAIGLFNNEYYDDGEGEGVEYHPLSFLQGMGMLPGAFSSLVDDFWT